MKRAIHLAVMAFGVMPIMAAQAQFCSTTCSRYEEGECVEHTQTCSTPSAAYSRTTGAFGYSYKWGSRSQAESAAMQNCAQHAKDCQVTVWYNHECGAVAADQGPTAFWGTGNTVSQARTAAQNECTKGGRKGCAVQVSQCSN